MTSLAQNDVLVQRIVESINRKNKDGITPLLKEYEILKKSLLTMQSKKDKVLGLYEDGVLGKDDLITRLASLNSEIERLEERIAPIEEQMWQGGYQKVNFKLVKQVMQNFMIAYKEALTPEQRKRLLHLLIHQITISDNRNIDTIQIQLNKEVIKHFDINGGENSSIADEFSPPFSVVFAI